jgi:endonuclease/exonuclease/phosphatase family metal-dependent hydrolase
MLLGKVAAVKFMSYNIQGHAAAGRPDFLPKVAEVIASANPDIVGIQEVHCGTRAGPVHQAEVLASLTGMNAVFGKSCAMDGGDYGNAVLTRGTIKSSFTHPLPGSGEPRSVLQTEISVDGIDVLFFATHLAAWGRLLRVARMRQVAELGDILARGSLPHVLAGDFNVPPGAEEIHTLLAHGHLHVIGDFREATFPMTRQRLDYIFADPRWQTVSSDVVRRGPSDHWAIVAELQLR